MLTIVCLLAIVMPVRRITVTGFFKLYWAIKKKTCRSMVGIWQSGQPHLTDNNSSSDCKRFLIFSQTDSNVSHIEWRTRSLDKIVEVDYSMNITSDYIGQGLAKFCLNLWFWWATKKNTNVFFERKQNQFFVCNCLF